MTPRGERRKALKDVGLAYTGTGPLLVIAANNEAARAYAATIEDLGAWRYVFDASVLYRAPRGATVAVVPGHRRNPNGARLARIARERDCIIVGDA